MTGARHTFLDHPRPIPIAHRGGSLEAEENTVEAFARAVGLGYTHIETDVHATRDGVVVIHHDETLDRMTGERVRIDALTWAELRRVRTHGGAPIPRADEVLEHFPDLFVAFEAKSDAVAAPLAEVIRSAGALNRVCAGAFSPRRTEILRHALGPDLCWSPAHAGVAGIWAAGWGWPMGGAAFQVLQVPPRFRGVPVVTSRLLRAAEARAVDVQVWTVDDGPEMERFLDLGVHGIMTDRPGRLRSVMERRGSWAALSRTGP